MTKNCFVQLIIDTDSKNAEILSDTFMDLNALSVSVSDEHEGTALEQAIFNEPGFEVKDLWQHSRLLVLFNTDTEIKDIVKKATEIIGKQFDYRTEYIDDQDWVRLTQSQFTPIKINSKLYIVPSWHTTPDNLAQTITLDPGLAFGTGSHPTTSMCLDWISNNVTKNTQTVLDYGCGSGILAIACKKFGAASVCGTDIDEQAITASQNNAIINHVDIKFTLPDQLATNIVYDVVIANILSNPLRFLAPGLAKLTKDKLILSGILDSQSAELVSIYNEWFNVEIKNVVDGWVLLECRK